MLKKNFICCWIFCFPGCLTNEVMVQPNPPTPPKITRFITVEHFGDVSRVRLKKVSRPFSPREINQIEQELKELTPRELEMLKKLLEQIYGPAIPPVMA